MRLMFVLILIFSPLFLEAYSCPSYLIQSDKAQKSYDWLERFKGQFQLHNCEVEIIVCDPQGEPSDSAPVGELLLVTENGREAYISIDFPEEYSWRFNTNIKSYPRSLYYRKKDRYYEPINGRTEIWQLEFRTLWNDLNELNHLEVGIYQTNSQLNQTNGNDSHWFVCSE